jgi:NADH-quinone oxidoreductase subunit C
VSDAASTETPATSSTIDEISLAIGEGPLPMSRFRDNVRVYLKPGQLTPALTTLRDRCGFLLLELGGVDYLGYPRRDLAKPRFEVHYVLLNPETHERVILKVGVDDPDPTIPSAVPLWRGADWMEREVFDMYGIRFEGHPDLRPRSSPPTRSGRIIPSEAGASGTTSPG